MSDIDKFTESEHKVFTRDPFAFLNAEKIPVDLRGVFTQQNFVIHLGFEKLEDFKHSTVFLAPQGGGKTISRLKLENSLQDKLKAAVNNNEQPMFMPLVVTYNEFTNVVPFLPNINQRHHVEPLMASVAEAIFDLMQNFSVIFLHLDQSRRIWWWAFLTQFLQGESIFFRFKNIELKQDWEKLRNYQENPFVSETTLSTMLKIACYRAGDFGITNVIIFVDEVDGYLETRYLDELADLIAPLLNTQALLTIPNLVWKIFLPADLVKVVLESKGYQSGRLEYFPIQWTEKNLIELLERRLEWGSDPELLTRSLTSICAYPKVDSELVNMALRHKHLGAPKALLKLASELKNDFSENQKLLTQKQWEDFVLEHQKDLQPQTSHKEIYKKALFAVVNQQRENIGTAFLAAFSFPDMNKNATFIITCAHVLRAITDPSSNSLKEVYLVPFVSEYRTISSKVFKVTSPQEIEREQWAAGEDIAVLELQDIPSGLTPLQIKNIQTLDLYQVQGKAFWGFGYEKTKKLRGDWVEDISIGAQVGQGFWEISTSSKPILPGMSGTPLSDNEGTILGIIQSNYGAQTAYLIPVGEIYKLVEQQFMNMNIP